MHLKRLALSGFKSFANQTELDFAPGVTAVVGPNGSGKSNVADAIQWVLGERGHKALRTHNAADVIFAGSANRLPVALAEVTIILDNADGGLPLQFSEVSIGRRIHPNGTSNYFINQKACRLRDIQDMLLDTGLGNDSFAVITQGQVDALLSLRPEDRRTLFEQVAGTQHYHVRRTESLRKLDRTQKNLTRVSDILHELEADLPRMEEQAELAQRYTDVTSRLHDLQVGLLGWQHTVRQQRLERLDGEHRLAQTEMRNVEAKITALQSQRQEGDDKLAAMEATLTKVQTEATNAVSAAKGVEGEIALANQQQTHWNERLGQVETETENLKQHIETASGRHLQVQSETANLTQAHQCTAEAITSLQSKLADTEGTLASQLNLLANRKEEHSEATRNAVESRNRLTELIHLEGAVEARLDGLETEGDQLHKQASEAHRRREKLDNQLEPVRLLHMQATESLKDTQRERANIERDLEEARLKVQTTREERSSAKSRLDALKEVEATLEGVNQGPRNVLLAARRGELTGTLDLVAHLIDVPAEYEGAIEAALGNTLQHIVTDTVDTARAAIAHLKRTAGGRATCLPLNSLRQPNRSRPALGNAQTPTLDGLTTATDQHLIGFIGWANDLMQINHTYSAALDYIASHIAIVRTSHDGVALAKQLNNTFRVVTLDGELFVPGGSMSGGQSTRPSQGLLAHRREVNELQMQVNQLDADIQHYETVKNNQALKVQELEGQLRDSRRQLENANTQLSRLQAEAEAETNHARRSDNQLKNWGTIHAQLQKELEQLCNEKHLAESKTIKIEDASNKLATLIATTSTQFEGLQKQRESIRTELAEKKLSSAQLHEKLAGLAREATEFSSQLNTREAQLKEHLGEQSRAQHEIERLQKHIPQLKERAEHLELMQSDTEEAFRRWGAERRALAKHIDEINENTATEMSERDQHAQELHKLELRVTQTRTELDDLERRFSDELQVDIKTAIKASENIEVKQEAEKELVALRNKVQNMGAVNVGAVEEYERLMQRLDFLHTQKEDLDKGKKDLGEIITQIDLETRDQLVSAVDDVERAFQKLFTHVFGGGQVELELTEPEEMEEMGIDVRAQLPGKALQDLVALSGGERAMTTLCLLFAMLKVKPAPFCILDELDAPLDESNVEKFGLLLQEFADNSQFIVITHNYGTLESVDRLYGVTMQEEGVSTVYSLALDGVREQDVAQIA